MKYHVTRVFDACDNELYDDTPVGVCLSEINALKARIAELEAELKR